MAVCIRSLCFLIVSSSFGNGQRYLLGETDVGDYYSDQADLTDPQFQPHPTTSLHNEEFYIPKDLHTSELPIHLQDTLPQYQQHHSKAPAPFQLSQEYIKPSTHRPDYSRVLPQHYRHEHFKTRPLELPSSDFEELNGNGFESEKNKHNPLNLVTKSNVHVHPVSNINKDSGSTNQLDTHFSKRDSTREATKNILNKEEYFEEPEESEVNYDNEDGANKTASEHNSDDKENNELDEEYDEEYEYDEDEEEGADEEEEEEEEVDESESENSGDKPLKNETFEVLTMKPAKINQNNTFNDFVDVDAMNTTTQEPAQSIILTQPPINLKEDVKPMKDFPEVVVSVVTSKTIINNTVISPITFNPTTVSTEPTVALPENSTDSWIVIASVQTSRSVSGTRYIPSSVVNQDERTQLLNEPTLSTEPSMAENKDVSQEADLMSSIAKTKTSTESLIDKLDRVQSDLSSGLLTGGFKNDNIAVIEENISTKLEITTEPMPSTTTKSPTTKAPYPQVNIRKFNPGNRATRPKVKGTESKRKGTLSSTTARSVVDQNSSQLKDALSSILQKVKPVEDLSALLPPGYKPPSSNEDDTTSILKNVKPVDDISALLPPGYKPPQPSASTEKTLNNILSKAKPVDDISALLPPGYKPSQPAPVLPKNILPKVKPVDDISALLPPGYKLPQATEKSTNLLAKAKPVDDISALLPPGYKGPQSGSTEKSVNNILSKAKPVDDISALLPPGYKKGFSKPKVTTAASVPQETVNQNIPANLLPPGYKISNTVSDTVETSTPSTTTPSQQAPSSGSGFKVVFPSRPGGGARKTPRLTTPRTQSEDNNKQTVPAIQKGWPVRASTEFTGWPTPSTTPISIEKLLEAARAAATSTTTTSSTEPSSTTTTTTTTTTTPRPTTPGICVDECNLAGTIKLVGGAKWVPELLDPNTKEYQLLSNSVQFELENIYNHSPILKQWYKKIRIDGFSEGSVLVDYLVELNEIGQKVNTQEIKRFFHESLTDLTNSASNREGKSLNESKAERYALGQFQVDPNYTDFVVIPKESFPTVGYADDVLLPQWAIAVIVIGLASLLFVIIFGVTVLFNRHKNAKKTPAPLTEDMLNELNKNHMGGFDNYGSDDFYNMEDVWSDKHYEQKPHKKRNNGSLYDNSTANLYDSWRSQWNGQWNGGYNSYYGNGNSSQHSGHSGFRRPELDTDF